jgi:hypothetical protein
MLQQCITAIGNSWRLNEQKVVEDSNDGEPRSNALIALEEDLVPDEPFEKDRAKEMTGSGKGNRTKLTEEVLEAGTRLLSDL